MTCIVVGDLHGDYEGCRRLLRQEGVIDETDQRVPGWHVVQVGDFIHGGHHENERDLTMVKRMHWFDVILLGNHDVPHVHRGRDFIEFHGMTPLDSRVTDVLRDCPVAHAIGDWLITHAGLDPRLALSQGVPPNAGEAAAFLNERFLDRLGGRQQNPLFDAIGARRGGIGGAGGIFWHDWRDLSWNRGGHWELFPVHQIVGHTPRPEGFEQSPDGRYWCVDAGAALSGMVSALISEDGETWRGVTYRRGA
jgi:hypothetical protein